MDAPLTGGPAPLSGAAASQHTMARRPRALPRRAFADLPVRWKILLPFALLALLYGVFGTYVFSRGTAKESRAALEGRLRDVAGSAAEDLRQREFLLGQTARLLANIEGVPGAVASRNRARLSRLVLPPAVNAAHALNLVVDSRGVVLLDARMGPDGTPRVRSGGRVGPAPLLDAVLGAQGERAVAQADLLRVGDTWFLAGAVSVRRGTQVVGATVVGDAIPVIVARLERLTGARLGMTNDGDATLAGISFPNQSLVARPAQASGRLDGEPAELLAVPFSIRGRRTGTVVIGLRAQSGLGALGGEGWKIALLAVGVLGGVLFVGTWVARRISQPLAQVLESTRALRRGQLGHRVRVDRGDEMGELAQSFNEMAEQLEASHQELERRVRERTRELAEALDRLDRTNAELARVSEAKSGFIADVSHELRTPLTAILLAADMLKDPSFQPLTEEKVRLLGAKVLASGQHLLGLIDELLDLAKIEAGRLETRPESVAVAALLAGVESTIRSMAEERQLRLDVRCPEDVYALADPLRLRQVLFNLLSNAVKFNRPRGRIRVGVVSSRRLVTVSVADTGIGIARSDLKRIFEPFERLQPGGNEQGVGLGLSISKKIVELQGGRLAVSSTPGRGSTFTVTLPAAAAPAARGETDDARPGRAAPAGRILVVEDDPAILDLAAGVLEADGHRIDRATAPAEALARARAARPSLVLLDVRLGDQDGLAVARRLRKDPRTRDVPIVALSAAARPEDAARARAAGCSGYLTKPLTGGQLAAGVAAFLGSAEAVPRTRRRSRAGGRR